MHKPRRSSLGPFGIAMALSLLLGFGFARALSATDDLRSQLDLFSQVLFTVQNNYVEQPDNEKLIKGAIDGMLKTLDPHTVFLPKQRAAAMDENFRAEYSGIGVQFDIVDNKIVVLSPIEGTPAYRLGIRAGDRIVEVDGKPLKKGLVNDDVFKLLKGPTGTTVEVAIERPEESSLLHFSIERAKIPIESVPYSYMIRPGIGYVRIIRFAQTTGEELEKAIASLRAQGMKNLLIDLRSNSGGLLNQAVDVLDQLVPEDKKLVYTRGRIQSSNADYYTTDRKGKWTDGALIVLVDHGSASASEIVSGAIQDLDRGLVAGINTFGKGLVQNQVNLSEGKLLLTVARYYTPSGRGIQRDYTKFEDQADYQADAFKEEVPTDSALATRPKFKTANGRTVYGGGGIYPDVVVHDSPNLTRPEIDMITKRAFFDYANHMVTAHKDVQWKSDMLARDKFKLSDADWKGLRDAITAKGIKMNDSTWTAEKPFAIHQLRAEIAQETLGGLERYKIAIEEDTQLAQTLELFPQAQKLLAGGAIESKAPKVHRP
ncbi:MAG TPA: S41 family peptidase [Candidatus Eisenbacteria bacterium]|jgi:carboxyl-terminal processing protease